MTGAAHAMAAGLTLPAIAAAVALEGAGGAPFETMIGDAPLLCVALWWLSKEVARVISAQKDAAEATRENTASVAAVAAAVADSQAAIIGEIARAREGLVADCSAHRQAPEAAPWPA